MMFRFYSTLNNFKRVYDISSGKSVFMYFINSFCEHSFGSGNSKTAFRKYRIGYTSLLSFVQHHDVLHK